MLPWQSGRLSHCDKSVWVGAPPGRRRDASPLPGRPQRRCEAFRGGPAPALASSGFKFSGSAVNFDDLAPGWVEGCQGPWPAGRRRERRPGVRSEHSRVGSREPGASASDTGLGGATAFALRAVKGENEGDFLVEEFIMSSFLTQVNRTPADKDGWKLTSGLSIKPDLGSTWEGLAVTPRPLRPFPFPLSHLGTGE